MRKTQFMRSRRKLAFFMMLVLLSSSLPTTAIAATGTKKNANLTSEKTLVAKSTTNEKDTDKDGVKDWAEQYFGSDVNKADTDGDGINDYDEIYVIHTNPTLVDTNSNNVADGNEDADNDSITNLKEYTYGTSLVKDDTDCDGLNDSDEIFTYKTDATVYDTDNDGANDGWEIKNNYSPLEKNTKFSTTKTMKSDDVSFTVKLDNATGKQVDTLGVNEVTQDIQIENSVPGYLGSCFEVSVDGSINSADVSFGFDKSLLNDANFKPAIYYYNEEAQILKELKDQTLTGNVISATATHTSQFILVNKSEFNNSNGIKLPVANPIGMNSLNKKGGMRILSLPADSDYDGMNDSVDSAPYSNTFTGSLVDGTTATSTVSYKMDYRAFFQSNSIYNSYLSTMSLLYSSVMYSGVTLSGMNATSLMSHYGFSNVVNYKLSDYYSDNHLSEVSIGHRLVCYNGVTKDIVGVFVRGTNGTIQEWSSNFDIGDTSDYWSTSYWWDIDNHKGFDIAATRILLKVQSYMDTYVNKSYENPIWITGHSRGAAIANILGSDFEDEGYNTYTYTFATPNTTTEEGANTYDSIFNIVNTDDFVPCLPMSAWGFTKYGRTARISLADNYEVEWENLTHISDYNPDTLGMQNTVDELAALVSNRDQCNDYTCDCHGDGSLDNITVRNYGTSQASREEAIAKIPSNALPYCKITRYTGYLFYGWDFDNCQTPSYFMQVLAAQMAGTISAYRFAVELDMADRYEAAKSAIISSAIGGLAHPHFVETYYVLSKHAVSSNFN